MEDQVFDIPSLWADVFSGHGQENQADSSEDLSSKIRLAHFSSVMSFLLVKLPIYPFGSAWNMRPPLASVT